MTAIAELTMHTECVAKLETIVNMRHWDGLLVVPMSEMPFILDTVEAGAVAAELSGKRPSIDVTYNVVTNLFMIVNKRFAQNLNRNYQTASIARTS